jgi:hypothetical protein
VELEVWSPCWIGVVGGVKVGGGGGRGGRCRGSCDRGEDIAAVPPPPAKYSQKSVP